MGRPPEVPAHLAPGLNRWVQDGILPGGFLRAVLANDLAAAVCSGDPGSRAALVDVVLWLVEFAPPDCWGSAETMERWATHRRKVREYAQANDPTLEGSESAE